MPDIVFTETAPVKVDFRIGDYSDALWFASAAERAAVTDAELQAMMQARYDNWLAVINAVPPAPTPEDLQAQLDALVAQQSATQEQIVAIAPPEVVLPILEGQATSLAAQIAALTPV
ncbi:MAG: hypothetical protein WCV99_14015 [Sterolibacterium sp.]|jgi:hypothetical protein